MERHRDTGAGQPAAPIEDTPAAAPDGSLSIKQRVRQECLALTLSQGFDDTDGQLIRRANAFADFVLKGSLPMVPPATGGRETQPEAGREAEPLLGLEVGTIPRLFPGERGLEPGSLAETNALLRELVAYVTGHQPTQLAQVVNDIRSAVQDVGLRAHTAAEAR